MNKTLERTQKHINQERRKFLDMLGKAGVSTSILKASTIAGGIFASRYAEAQENNRKIIFIYLPDGAPSGTWLPSGGFAGKCTEALEPHATNIAFTEADLSFGGYGGGHGNTFGCMGATSYNPREANSSSLNFQMAKIIGALTPYSSVQLGVLSGQGSTSDSISKLDGAHVTNEDRPSAAFQQLFNSAPPTPTGGGSAYDQERSVLDVNKAALDALKTKLGQEERIRLETHIASLDKIKARIDTLEQQEMDSSTGGGGACSPPSLNNEPGFLGTLKAQSDVAVGALKCGLTRVVSIQCNYHQASWVGGNSGVHSTSWTSDHHQSCHGGPTSANVEMLKYLNKGVAYLIARLKSEGLLGSTMVVQVTDMGNGQDHTPGNGPFLIASGIPGFRSMQRRTGASFGNVLADAVKGMGLSSHVGGVIHNYGAGNGVF